MLEDGDMIHCEVYTTNKHHDVYNRALELSNHLINIAEEYKPDKVSIEGLSFGSTGNVTRDLGGLLFTIIIAFRQIGKHVEVIPPPTVKKVATGKGNVKKDAVIAALPKSIRQRFDTLGVKKTTGLSDLADAYYIACAI